MVSIDSIIEIPINSVRNEPRVPLTVVRRFDIDFTYRAVAAEKTVEFDGCMPLESNGRVESARGEVEFFPVDEPGDQGALFLPRR